MTPARKKDQPRRDDPIVVPERTLPHDLEAERAVLGAAIMHNATYSEATRWIKSHDFFRDAHRRVWLAIEKLLERPHGSCDLLLVKDELLKQGDLDECGGPAYLGALVDGIPRSTNVRHYAQVVREKSLLRGVIYAGNKMASEAYDADQDASVILNAADRAIVELQHGVTDSAMQSVKSSSGRLLDMLEERVAHRGELTGVNTGFDSINNLTFGWQRGDVIVVAARPSIGKTTFVLNTTVAACESMVGERRGRAAFFSMEMKRHQLELRLLSSMSGVHLDSLMSGWIADESWTRITQAIGRLDAMDLHIDDAPSRTVFDIRRECRRLKAEGGLDLVVIDYVQLMPGTLDRKGATRNEEVTDISRKLKVIAGELDVAVILLSQLSRAAEGRNDKRPQLSDLRESGALEQDADLVCFLHRRHHREGGITNFIIDKQRNGSGGTVNLTMHRETTSFSDCGEETPAQAAATEEAAAKAEKASAKTRAIVRNQQRKRTGADD